MKIPAYLLIGAVIILVIVMAFTFINTVVELNTLANRVEDSMIASGWVGLSKMDLDKLAKRTNMADEESREIYLDKLEAENIVRDYIRRNLKLDSSFYPTDESYIPDKSHPVLIEEFEVFNPGSIPDTCSRGNSIKRTTIHIVVKIPVSLKWMGFKYLEKHVDVDVDSFFKN